MELKIRGLSKTYPNGVRAVRAIDLTVGRGLFGLLGPNGAGKSTLLRVLATVQQADSGSVLLGDIDVLKEKAKVRGQLGYLPQNFGLYPKERAESLLDYFAALKGFYRRAERREIVEAMLRTTNLVNARKQKLETFSGGMRQRFGIAVALMSNPQLIIVDEPTAGLDPTERTRLLDLFAILGEQRIVILSTHIVEDLVGRCTKMGIIFEGQVLLESSPSEAIRSLEGKIWQRPSNGDASEEAGESFCSLRIRFDSAGRKTSRAYSEASLDPPWEPAAPDLRDVFFVTIDRARLDSQGEEQSS